MPVRLDGGHLLAQFQLAAQQRHHQAQENDLADRHHRHRQQRAGNAVKRGTNQHQSSVTSGFSPTVRPTTSGTSVLLSNCCTTT